MLRLRSKGVRPIKKEQNYSYDPRKQFSKWLARSSSWFWFIYLVILAGLMAYRPETADAIIYIILIVSAVMVFHVWAYTKNSTYQKGIEAMLSKTKMELSLKSRSGSTDGEGTEEESEG